jgi:hypothetical protein
MIPFSISRFLSGFLVVVVLAKHLKIGVTMVPAMGPSLYMVYGLARSEAEKAGVISNLLTKTAIPSPDG